MWFCHLSRRSTGEEASRKWPPQTFTTANCGRHLATGSTTATTCSPSPWRKISLHSSPWTAPGTGKNPQRSFVSSVSVSPTEKKCDSRHVTVVPCLRPLLLLQPDVQPQASLVEGAPAEAGRFRRAAQERAVGNAERSDQSAALPAGRRSHLLPHGSGEGTTSFQKWRCWRSLNLWMKHATAYYESPPEFWFIWDFFFLLDYRLSLRWKAASTSCGVFMTFLDSPSSFTSPHAQRSIWGTSPCGTRPRRWRMSCIVDKNFRTIDVDFKLKIRHKVWNEELDHQN